MGEAEWKALQSCRFWITRCVAAVDARLARRALAQVQHGADPRQLSLPFEEKTLSPRAQG